MRMLIRKDSIHERIQGWVGRERKQEIWRVKGLEKCSGCLFNGRGWRIRHLNNMGVRGTDRGTIENPHITSDFPKT